MEANDVFLLKDWWIIQYLGAGKSAYVKFAYGAVVFDIEGENSTRLTEQYDSWDLADRFKDVMGEGWNDRIEVTMFGVLDELGRFRVYDVQIGETFLSVSQMEELLLKLDRFVPVKQMPSALDYHYVCQLGSWNLGGDKFVLRPQEEYVRSDGERLILWFGFE